ncbi:MAG: sigma-54 dependent transcriptional regulator [Planctomycetes bacterium]|nr:sigma-54 dependent transcriptional regulator [Planctomycetota bacterium]
MRVLIVDDERDIRDTLDMVVRYQGYETSLAASAVEALKVLEGPQPPDVCLLDVKMPGRDGLDLLAEIKDRWPSTAVVMVSGHGDAHTGFEAARRGAYEFLEKPLSEERVLLTIRNAAARVELQKENLALKRKVDDQFRILGTSKSILQIGALIEKVAPTQARVLVTGENGTGKELVARNLHERSPRWNKAFVEVNCAAIPKELIESELFGHEKGSFTGAQAARKGRFELADGGTLFLDEIGDMDASAQAKMLRVLETGMVHRVGSEEGKKVDVRVIAATNRDLTADVADGRFREDLLYRLNVVEIHLPALHERRDDVPLLARHFLAEACRRNEITVRRLAEPCESWLAAQTWPGNVRQLRNLMERLAILADCDPISAAEGERLFQKKASAESVQDPFAECESFEQFKDVSEKMFLERKLLENDGNIKRTAERLSMMRSNLYKKIEKYHLR